ncbi:MAG: hypothetical protein JJV95_06635 [Sulfurospirillum sp.]|nr:hypothetical protein [Sulfurospirillum sp.]MBL0703639.1 hypothetical protein [Sulfurospirillum sp.]
MRFSYKKLVNRFLIPRPTLIEWQKRVKQDTSNWRVEHLNYLREQLVVEELTLEELKSKFILVEDIFLVSVFMFFNDTCDCINKNNFKKELRVFAYANRQNVEYRHEFALKIWSIELNDGSEKRVANYLNVIDILDNLTAAQFSFFIRKIKQFLEHIRTKLKPSHTDLLDGVTWQELHMYNKAFNSANIVQYFEYLDVNH